jgi:hypothetical protein
MTPGRNRSVASFADKGFSKLYRTVGDSKPLAPLDAFAEATKERIATRKAWIERLRCVADEQFQQVIAPVPDERMSASARRFAYELLRLNKAKIMQLDQ